MSDRLAEALAACQKVPVSTQRSLAQYKEGAKVRNFEFGITDDEADALFRKPCHYCDYLPPNRFNGIDRVVNSIGYVKGNVVPCCMWCNRAKGRRPAKEFMDWLTWVQAGSRWRTMPISREATWEPVAVNGEYVEVATIRREAKEWRSPAEGKRVRDYVRQKVWGK